MPVPDYVRDDGPGSSTYWNLWIPAFQGGSQLAILHLLLFRHSGLDPESSVVSRRSVSGCRSKIPFLAGIKSGMTDRN